jgi:hypothetical protein
MGELSTINVPCNQDHCKLSHLNTLTSKKGKSCVFYNSLKICHQNICGLKSKTNEQFTFLYPDLPHIICISEHHLKYDKIKSIVMENYIVGASYC